VGLISINLKPNVPLIYLKHILDKNFNWGIGTWTRVGCYASIAIWMFYDRPNHKQKKIKSLKYSHREIGLCTKGSFHESGQCNYIKYKITFSP